MEKNLSTCNSLWHKDLICCGHWSQHNSTVTLSRRIYEQIPVSQRPDLRPVTKFSKMEAANDSLLDIDVVVSLNSWAGGQNFEWNVYIPTTKKDGD